MVKKDLAAENAELREALDRLAVCGMQQVDEQLYTPQEIAEYLRVDIRTVYRWLRDGEMDAIRFRRECRVSESALRKFIEERSTNRERGTSRGLLPSEAGAGSRKCACP